MVGASPPAEAVAAAPAGPHGAGPDDLRLRHRPVHDKHVPGGQGGAGGPAEGKAMGPLALGQVCSYTRRGVMEGLEASLPHIYPLSQYCGPVLDHFQLNIIVFFAIIVVIIILCHRG